MWLQASCSLEFNVSVSTPFLLMLRPRSGAQQWVAREQYVLAPSVPAVEFTDPFGNLCQRLVALPGPFSVQTSADIEVATPCRFGAGNSMRRGRGFRESRLPRRWDTEAVLVADNGGSAALPCPLPPAISPRCGMPVMSGVRPGGGSTRPGAVDSAGG